MNKYTNKSITELTKSRLKSAKWLVIASAIASLAVNTVALIVLLIGGYDFTQFLVPLGLFVLDVCFLLAVIASNFRFRYSTALPILYILFTLAGAVWTFLSDGITTESVRFSNVAMGIWLGVHAICCFAVLFSALKAAKLGVNGKAFNKTAILLFALLLVTGGFYGYSVFKDGAYGQGIPGKEKTLEYVYDAENDVYVVTSVMKGRGDTVVIPEQFNGKPVSAVDCELFEDKSIKKVYFEDATISLISPKYLVTEETEGRVLYVNKADCDLFRERFFAEAYAKKDEDFLRVANATIPTGLEKNEVFVTFTYDWEDFLAVNGKTVDTWFGNKGETLKNDSLQGVEYLSRTDISDFDQVYWSYDNLDKRIYKDLTFGGESVLDTTVIESLTNAKVEFDPLFYVNVGDDNDGQYESSDSFKYGTYKGTQRPRIVTMATADDYLASIELRDGFTLGWAYDDEKIAFTSLKEILFDSVDIYPVWTLNAPTVETLATDATNGVATYGDAVEFSVGAVAPQAALQLRYEWKKDGATVATTDTWDYDCIYPQHAGKYTVEVVSYSDTLTTLTSSVSVSISIVVNKKALGFTWTLPESNVYSAEEKPIVCNYVEADRINNDTITFDISLDSVRNVGDYQSKVVLTDSCAELYYIPKENEKVDFTVIPYAVDVVWEYTSFIYNTEMQAPSASAMGIGEDGALSIEVSGAQKNASALAYTATATTNNQNYIFNNPTQEFTIAPYNVEASWTGIARVYNGYAQQPAATVAGLDADGDLPVEVTGAQKNISDSAYTATVTTSDTNYTIVNPTVQFTITPYEITVTWTNTSLIYTASKQKPNASAVGLGEDGYLPLVVAGEQINASDVAYTASVTTTDRNYTIKNSTQNFTIVPYEAQVAWTKTSLVYNASMQMPTASLTGLGNDGALPLTVSGAEMYASDAAYTATVTTSNTNYTITNPTVQFTIKPYQIAVTWTNTSFTYDGAAHKPSASAVGLGEDGDLPLEITGEQTNARSLAYTASVSTTDTNYSIKNPTQNFTILPYETEVTWGNTSFVYNTNVQTPTASAEGINGDGALPLTVTGGKTNASASAYTATVTTSNTNYKLINSTVEFIIAPYEIAVTWTNTSLIYTASKQKPSASAVGLDKDGSLPLKVTGDQINVSDLAYTASVTTTNTNYTITNPTQSFTISPYETEVTWGNTSLIYNAKQQTPAASLTGLGSDGAVSLTISGAQMDASDLVHTATVTTTNANYTITNPTTTFTISPYNITVKWTNTALVYNTAAQMPKASATGLGNDGALPLTVTGAQTYARTAAYTATVTTSNANYTIANPTTSFTISPYELTVKWTNTSFTYDGEAHMPSASVTALGSDLITVTVTGEQVNAGKNYQAVATIDNTNYALSNATKQTSFTIEKRGITLIWGESTFKYDGKEHAVSVVDVTGEIGSDEAEILSTLKYSQTSVKDAGKTTVTATLATSGVAANYYIQSGASCVCTVTPITLTVDWSACQASYQYDGKAKTVNPKITGLLSGDSGVIKYVYKNANSSTSVNQATNAGTYTVTIEITGSNYVFATGTKTVFEFSITPISVTLTVNKTSFTYDGTKKTPTLTLSRDGVELVITYYRGKVVSEAAKMSSAPTEVGTYTVYITTKSSNYVLVGGAKTVTMEIVASK